MAGTAPAVAHRALGGEPDLDALAGREAVRDERRLERDDAAAVARARRDLLGDADHGIAPSFAQQRAAASSPRRRRRRRGSPPRTRRRRRSRPRPPSARPGRTSPSTTTPSAPRFTIQRRRQLPERLALALDREHDVGRERPRPRRGTRRRSASTRRGRATPARPPRAPARPRAAPPPRPAPASARSPTRAEHRSGTTPPRARPAASSGALPRSETIVRSPAAAIATTTPVRPPDRPDHLDAAPARARRATSSPAASAPRFVTSRAVGAERRRPRGHVRGLPAGRRRASSRRGRRRARAARRGSRSRPGAGRRAS